MLNKWKEMENTPRNRLYNALLTLSFLNANEKKTTALCNTLLILIFPNTNEKKTTAAKRHWIIEKSLN